MLRSHRCPQHHRKPDQLPLVAKNQHSELITRKPYQSS
jgi:hypothetical protein